MFTFIIMCGGYIYGTLLTANDSLAKMNRVFGWSVLLNIIFNYLLIPKYGALGAAYTTFFTQGFALISQILIAQKEFSLKIDLWLLGRFLLLTLALFGSGYLINNYLDLSWFFQFMALLMIGAVLGLLLFFKRRVLEEWSLGQLLK